MRLTFEVERQGPSVHLVFTADPIKLRLSGQTDAPRGPLNLDTKTGENFKPPVSRRAITHYDEDVIGIRAWSLHLELEHVVVVWHHLQFSLWKRHAEDSVVEVCTTDNEDKVFYDT